MDIEHQIVSIHDIIPKLMFNRFGLTIQSLLHLVDIILFILVSFNVESDQFDAEIVKFLGMRQLLLH